MKKNFVMMLIISLVFILFASPLKAMDELIIDKLESLNRNERMEYLIKEGLELPQAYKGRIEYTNELIERLLQDIKNGYINSEVERFNDRSLNELCDQLLSIVDNDSTEKNQLMKGDDLLRDYGLRDSRTIGSWRDSYLRYNCYAYALNMRDRIGIGDYSNQVWKSWMSVSHTADIVIDDLRNMGFTSYKTYRAGDKIYARADVIALRVGPDDYHFMKDVYRERDWEHKPGSSQPLSWNYSSPESRVWTNEAVIDGRYYPENTRYDSHVVYIYYWPQGEGPSPSKVKALMKMREIFQNKVFIK